MKRTLGNIKAIACRYRFTPLAVFVYILLKWGFDTEPSVSAYFAILTGILIALGTFFYVLRARNRLHTALKEFAEFENLRLMKKPQTVALASDLKICLDERVYVEQAWIFKKENVKLIWIVYWKTGKNFSKELSVLVRGVDFSQKPGNLAKKYQASLTSFINEHCGLPAKFHVINCDYWLLISPDWTDSTPSSIAIAHAAALKVIDSARAH